MSNAKESQDLLEKINVLKQQLAVADSRVTSLYKTVEDLEKELKAEKDLRINAEVFLANVLRAQLLKH